MTFIIFRATSLKPFCSNRFIMSAISPRCTPSGFTMMKVRSVFAMSESRSGFTCSVVDVASGLVIVVKMAAKYKFVTRLLKFRHMEFDVAFQHLAWAVVAPKKL